MAETIESEGEMLAVVLRSSDEVEDISFFTPSGFPLQLGMMERPQGYRVEPHRHLDRESDAERIQEIVFVRDGTVRAEVYAGDELFRELHLEEGDVALFNSGHGFEVKEDAEMIAVKQGPYEGEERDKEAID